MAGPYLADTVRETSTTTGTGALNLTPVSNRRTFVDGIGDGNTCLYFIRNQSDESEWEEGVGTVASGSPDTLTRTSVRKSSNSDAAVNFSAGTKEVYCARLAALADGEIAVGAGSGRTLITDFSHFQATQSAIEAETNENTYTPPDLIRHALGFAKYWVKFNGTGTIAIDDSYNVAGLVDDGTGEYTVTIDDDFSSVDWCHVTGGYLFGGSAINALYRRGAGTTAQAAGSVKLAVGYITESSSALQDSAGVYSAGFGDQ